MIICDSWTTDNEPLSIELCSWATELGDLFKPGYSQAWAQLGGGHGEASVNRVHEFVKTSSSVHRNEKGWRALLYTTDPHNQPPVMNVEVQVVCWEHSYCK